MFPDRPIISVEFDERSADVARLAGRSNVTLLFGDAEKKLPELLQKGDAVLIDGPKMFRAIRLALRLLATGKPVAVFIHDMKFGTNERAFLDRFFPEALSATHARSRRVAAPLDADAVAKGSPHTRLDGFKGDFGYGFSLACIPLKRGKWYRTLLALSYVYDASAAVADIMRIRYIAFMRLPTERAHGIQIMQMCAAFVRAGAQVELIVTARGVENEDPFAYYGISERFEIKRIEAPDMPKLAKIGVFLPYLLSPGARRAMCVARYRRATYRMLATRCRCGFLAASSPLDLSGKRTRAIRGTWSDTARAAFALIWSPSRRARGTFGCSRGSRAIGSSSRRMGSTRESSSACRHARLLGWNSEYRRTSASFLYTGHLYGWKGATTLAKTASLLPEDALVFFRWRYRKGH